MPPACQTNCDLVASDDLADGATLGGDAALDGEFGLVLDGDGDYLEIGGDDLIKYAADASFSISMWFTRQTCAVHGGWYEMLFSHQAGDETFWNSQDTRIYVMVGCDDVGGLPGNVVRTEMQDGTGQQLAFDFSLPTNDRDSYTNTWVHMILSVEPTSIRVYRDGERVTTFGYETPGDGGTDSGDENTLTCDDNLACPDPGVLTAELQGFTLQGFADNSDYYYDVELAEGAHMFHAVDEWGDGWQGGYFEVGYDLQSRSPELLVGGIDPDTGVGPGQVITDGQHLSFRVAPGESRPLQVHIKTGEWASEYSWAIDDGNAGQCGGVVCDGEGDGPCGCDPCPACSNVLSGPPAANPLRIGGSSDGYSSFFGSVAAVSLHRRPTSDNDAECLFGFGQGMVAMCEDYTAQDYFSSTNWLLLNGTLTADATLSDDAFMDSDFGVVMDGRGDALTVAGDSLTYASYGRFSISLWFTKHECTIPGRFEYLWRHERGGWQSSSIRMYIGCASQGVGSTIEGDIVRTRLIDGDGKKVTFDWGVSAERGNGAINAEWVHVVLSVDRSAVQVFVDAKPVVDYGFEIDDWEFAWAQTEDNLAWPNGPTQLSSRLGGFPIGTSYDSRTDYFHTLELDAGEHTFNAYADYGSWHGGWFAITNSAGELVAGGEDDKPDENENSYAFTIDDPAGAVLTLRITTGRWVSDISWTVDDGATYSGPPAAHSLRIGGSGYLGSMNSISIHRNAMDAKDAECIYDFGMQYLRICRDFDLLIGDGVESDDVSLIGNAYVDGMFGVRLDGDDDTIKVEGESTFYAADGTFSISLWFTKGECAVKPDDWSSLWSHRQLDGWSGWRSGSAIDIYLSCDSTSSTLGGDIIRTRLRDSTGQFANFDWSVTEEKSNGYLNAVWVHMVLSVSSETISMYVDGTPVQTYGFRSDDCSVGTDCTDCGDCPTDGGAGGNDDSCTDATGLTVANDGDCDVSSEMTDQNLVWCGDDASDGKCAGPLSLSAPFSGFAMGGYADQTDYYVDMTLDAGEHIMHGVDTFGDGWQGGWFEITQPAPGCYSEPGVTIEGCSCHRTCSACGYTYGRNDQENWPVDADDCVSCADGSIINEVRTGRGTCTTGSPSSAVIDTIGGEGVGTVRVDHGYWAFSLAAQTTVTLHLHTGDWADEYQWSIDDGASPGQAGPTGHALSVGGSIRGDSVRGAFFGGIASVSVHSYPLDAEAVDCLNQFGEGLIQVCEDPLTAWHTNWVLFNGTVREDVTLNGDAYLDTNFGVLLDGDGDSISVGGDLASSYAVDGSWSLSLWFTRRECEEEGRFEGLYAHNTNDGGWWGSSRDLQSNVHIYIGCSQQGVDSTLDGDVVRTMLADRAGQKVCFDWPVSAEDSNGLVNNIWVHMVLSVSSEKVEVFTDGKPIEEYGFVVGGRSNRWARTSANLAYPDGPTSLTAELQGFSMGSAYSWDTDYYLPLVMPAGGHTFLGDSTSRWGSGWNGGFFEIFSSAGELIAGGTQDGMITDDGANVFAFTLEESQTVTLHIKTARYAHYIRWTIDDGSVFSGPPPGLPFTVGAWSPSSSSSFSGAMGMVSIHSTDLDATQAECLYQFGLNYIQICEDPQEDMRHLVFDGAFGDDQTGQLLGNTYFDDGNLVFDGANDQVSISGGAVLRYPSRERFSISMWFTRKECQPGVEEFEQLFYHGSERSPNAASTSQVSVFIGCSQVGGDALSTLDGDVVRTVLEDVAGNQAVFDWSVSAERTTGLINQNWVHMLLSVNVDRDYTRHAASVYVDGFPVTTYGFPAAETSAETNMAYTCGASVCETSIGLTLSNSLGSFGMGGYANRAEYFVDLSALSNGEHQFHGMDSSSDGWDNGGFYAICEEQCRPEDVMAGSQAVIAGGPEHGRTEGAETLFPAFTKEDGQQLSLWIHIVDWGNEVSWDITGSDIAYPPTASDAPTLYLGGCRSVPANNTAGVEPSGPEQCTAGSFLGEFAMVSLLYDDVGDERADCIYQWSKDFVDLCEDPSYGRGVSFALKFVDGVTPDGLTLVGNAEIGDGTMSAGRLMEPGLSLAGFATGYGTVAGGGFAAGDGDYTLSVWFTKHVCDLTSNTFTILAQDEVGDKSKSYITAQIVCGGADSSLGESAIRVAMQDVDGVYAVVDLPLQNNEARSGGVITDMWCNLVWAVTNGDNGDGTSITFYVDGNVVPTDEIGFPTDQMGDGTDNIAFPDPANFRAQFGSFNMDNSYANNADAFEVVEGLTPGETYTFLPIDSYGDGWDDNGWFEIMVPAAGSGGGAAVQGERIAGGEEAGIVEGSGSPVSFTMPVDATAVRLSGRAELSAALFSSRLRCWHR